MYHKRREARFCFKPFPESVECVITPLHPNLKHKHQVFASLDYTLAMAHVLQTLSHVPLRALHLLLHHDLHQLADTASIILNILMSARSAALLNPFFLHIAYLLFFPCTAVQTCFYNTAATRVSVISVIADFLSSF